MKRLGGERQANVDCGFDLWGRGDMRVRYLLVLLLAGCTASNWTREGATTADLDRDYEECRQIAKPDPAIAAIAGAFGAVGVFVGTRTTDSKIRSCLQGRGWTAAPDTKEPKASTAAATAGTSPSANAVPAAPAPVLVKTVESESPAAKRLKELNELLDQGLITKEEYEEKRQAVLRGL